MSKTSCLAVMATDERSGPWMRSETLLGPSNLGRMASSWKRTSRASSILHVDASFKNPKEMSEEQHRPPPGWRECTAYRHVMHESFRILYAFNSISYMIYCYMSI